jgi:hypothetical protein
MRIETQNGSGYEDAATLRAEIRELEGMGQQLANGLEQEQRTSAALRTEVNNLRRQFGARGYGWPLRVNETLLLLLSGQLLSASWSLALASENSESLKLHIAACCCATAAQLGLSSWCVGIWRAHGLRGLWWRLLVLSGGWAVSLYVLIGAHEDQSSNIDYFVSMAMPSNWWMFPQLLMTGWLHVAMTSVYLAVTLDALLKFKLARKFGRDFLQLIEEVKSHA